MALDDSPCNFLKRQIYPAVSFLEEEREDIPVRIPVRRRANSEGDIHIRANFGGPFAYDPAGEVSCEHQVK